MIGLNPGVLVELLARPEWGPGKVLDVNGDKIRVHFRDDPAADYRTLDTKLAPLRVAEHQSDPQLDNLSPFADGRFKSPASRVTFGSGVERFLQLFPAGFLDERYIGTGTIGRSSSGERLYKLNACDRYGELLGGEVGGKLLRAGDLDELVRRACRVASQELNLLSPYESMAFRDGLLADRGAASRYFEALFAFTSDTPMSGRSFDGLADAVRGLPCEKGKARVATWPVVTILPALADRTRFIFVKPEITKECAERLRFEIQYDSQPRWITFRKVLDMADLLLERLRHLGARDYIDVQSFMWVIARYENRHS